MRTDGGVPRRRVAVVGLGRLGVEIVRACERSCAVDLVAVVSRRGAAAVPAGVTVATYADLGSLLEAGPPEVVLDAVSSSTAEVLGLMEQCAAAGCDLVTTSAMFDPVLEVGAGVAARLNAAAAANGARLVATGLVPGLVLDELPALLSTLAPGWEAIEVTRAVEAGGWGASTREALGIGAQADELEAARIPMSLLPSVSVLGRIIGVTPTATDEHRTAITDGESRRAVGFQHVAAATDPHDRRVTLRWLAAVGLEELRPDTPAGVAVQIAGAQPLRCTVSGAFSGDPYPATAERVLRVVAALCAARPGLLTAPEIPALGLDRRP